MGCGRKSSGFGKEGLGPNPGFLTFFLSGLSRRLSSSGTGMHYTLAASSQARSYEEMCTGSSGGRVQFLNERVNERLRTYGGSTYGKGLQP